MCFGEQLNLLRVKQIHRKLRFSSFPKLMNRLDNSATMSQILFHQRDLSKLSCILMKTI